MTARLQNLKLHDDGYTVTVRPEVVVEVAYDEIQRSPPQRVAVTSDESIGLPRPTPSVIIGPP